MKLSPRGWWHALNYAPVAILTTTVVTVPTWQAKAIVALTQVTLVIYAARINLTHRAAYWRGRYDQHRGADPAPDPWAPLEPPERLRH